MRNTADACQVVRAAHCGIGRVRPGNKGPKRQASRAKKGAFHREPKLALSLTTCRQPDWRVLASQFSRLSLWIRAARLMVLHGGTCASAPSRPHPTSRLSCLALPGFTANKDDSEASPAHPPVCRLKFTSRTIRPSWPMMVCVRAERP